MRGASNDVIPSAGQEARHQLVVTLCVMSVALLVTSTATVQGAASTSLTPDPVEVVRDAPTNENAQIYTLRMMFICDATSSEHCTLDTLQSVVGSRVEKLLNQAMASYGNTSKSCDPEDPLCNHSKPGVFNASQSNASADHVSINITEFSLHVTRPISPSAWLHVHVTFRNASGGFYVMMEALDAYVTSRHVDVIVCLGDHVTVQTAALVADSCRIPCIGYVTTGGHRKNGIQGRTFTGLNPEPQEEGTALAHIIGRYNMNQTVVIVEESRLADGFLSGVRAVTNQGQRDVFETLPLHVNISRNLLLERLVHLSNTGWKIMVVHACPQLMLKVVTSALSTRLYNTGHAWFLSEAAFSRSPAVVSQLPEGLLAIDGFWLGGLPDVMTSSLGYVIPVMANLINNHVTSLDLSHVPYPDDLHIHPYSYGDLDPKSNSNASNQRVYRNLFHMIDDTQFNDSTRETPHRNSLLTHFLRCLRAFILKKSHDPSARLDWDCRQGCASQCKQGAGEESNHTSDLPTSGPAFNLLNTVANGSANLMWTRVGYITTYGRRNLRTMLWPGQNIYGPASNSAKTYRVVTRPAEPFVFITGKVNAKEECTVDLTCLQVANGSHALLTRVVEDFQTERRLVNALYTMHCCKGLALELLAKLSEDLNFRYVVYFVNDSNYGTHTESGWTGMVGDVIDGGADVIAGAFSMTSSRMSAIHFTTPFYNNDFAVAAGQDGNYVSMWAFMSPFSGQVWLCIFLSSFVAGIATSFLEWHSPFGLNPKGRKRTKNYSLGSGLLMVMVLLTGHTINVKAPKSWPGKVIQNVWAGLAIFIMTSYTANLAAYLAGQSAVPTAKNVFDPELVSKRAAVLESSAVEKFLEKVTPKLAEKAKVNYVDSTMAAINGLRDGSIDIYFDDTPLLEYGLALYDKDCKVYIAGKGFGSGLYAFGLTKHSWLKIPMSNMIAAYTESGLVQELASKYNSRPQCKHFLVGIAKPYGLEHTGGLFLILVSSVLLSIVLLVCEHLVYHFAVPWMRGKPAGSFWKTESLSFVSQRMSRVVQSEKLYSQKQAAQEMITIVRQRDFTRLIQKNELQKRRVNKQKRVKTKAEVFQEITANIVSYHRQLQEECNTMGSSDNIAIDMDVISPDDLDLDGIGDLEPNVLGVNNAAYSGDSSLEMSRTFSSGRYAPRCDASDDDIFTEDETEMFDDIIEAGTPSMGRKLSSRSWALATPSFQPDSFSGLQRRYTSHPSRPPRRRKRGDDYDMTSHLSTPRGRGFEQQGGSLYSPATVCDSTRMHPLQCPIEISEEVDREDSISSPLSVLESMSSPLGHSSFTTTSGSVSPSPPLSQLPSPTRAREVDSDSSLPPLAPPPPPSLSPKHHQAASDSDFHGVIQPPRPDCSKSSSPRPVPEIHLDPVKLRINSQPAFSLQGNHSLHKPETPFRRSASAVFASPCRLSDNRDGMAPLSPGRYRRLGERGQDLREADSKLPASQGMEDKVCHRNSVQGVAKGRTNIRKYSDISGYRSDSPTDMSVPNNNRRTKSYDKQSRDYFKRNLKLKDNRVKSTLRRHAMSAYQSQLPADFIDECTLEALSKEDLLILWKKSEIDLEGKLHEVLARNKRLGLAIDYLTRPENQHASQV